MALPILYWLLECTECGARRVVHDTYRLFVGTTDPCPVPGAGYTGPPLPERYKCKKACSAPMRVLGSLHDPQDRTMWLHEPHKPIQMTRSQINEWRRLIRDAGFEIPS
jgi:hypothetical protein